MATKTFRLEEDQWATAMRLTTSESAERDAWWADLGADLGFKPGTVEFVRAGVFRAETTRAKPKVPEAAAAAEIDVPVYRKKEPARATTVATSNGKLVMLDQYACARCGGTVHHGITYRKLTNPVVLAGETLTHYAWCPKNGEPLLLAIFSESEEDGNERVPADLECLLVESGEPRTDPLKED